MLEICGPTNAGRLTMPDTASVASFSGRLAVGELCSTPSHYTEPALNELSCNCLINATCPSACSVAPWQGVNQT